MSEEKDNSNSEEILEPDNTSVNMRSFDLSKIDELDNALAQLVNLNSDKIHHEPTCSICSSASRKEVEALWAASQSHSEVQELLKTKCKIEVSESVIDNHVRYHLSEKGIQEIQKVEYSDRLKRLNSVELTTLDRIRLCFSALTERLMGINSITPSGDLSAADIEKIKSSETSRLMGSFNQLLKLQASIMGEMRNNGELIIIPRQIFINVFNDAIAGAATNEEKTAIRNILVSLGNISKNIQ